MKRHQPKHIYKDNQIYFITAHIQDRAFVLDDASKKDKLLLKFHSFAWEKGIALHAWVVLQDHYHLLLKISEGSQLPQYIGDVHRGFTYEMNQLQGRNGRCLWKNYWDWCVRDEKDYWKHFNYIHNNPIKHGIVNDTESLKMYRYSSFWNYMRKNGIQWLMDAMETHPVLDFTVKNDV